LVIPYPKQMVYHLERQREVELLHMRVHEHALSPPLLHTRGIPKAVLRQLGYTLLCTGAGLRFEHHYLDTPILNSPLPSANAV
jgi:hypothetical protein